MGGPTGTYLHPQIFLVNSQLLRTRKALEQMTASHRAEDITFLRECYGPISFKCDVTGCLRYGVGFETLQERDDHVRSHKRPLKCPEDGCFYGEAGFANEQSLNQHISRCHTNPAANRFVFPKLRNSLLPEVGERKRFREAIMREDLDLLRDMIGTNSSLKCQLTLDGYTGLQHAARYGKLESARCLLQCGSNISLANHYGTALHVACKHGQRDIIQLLLSNFRSDEDMNGKDNEGRTPLSLIAARQMEGAASVVKMLLTHDGINAKDTKGRTPLSWAASKGTAGVVETFLEHGVGVDVNAKDNNGRTPLSLAAGRWLAAVPVVEVLLGHDGVDVNARDNEGRPPLSWAASKGAAGVVEMLLRQNKIVVDARDNEGKTPLSCAARAGDVGVIKLFLEHGVGVDVNAKDKEGRTPLSLAAERRGSRAALVVKALLEHDRVDVNSADNNGQTPLSWAASRGFWESDLELVVKMFLQQNRVRVDAKDDGGRTPLSWATNRSSLGVVRLFLEHGVGVDINARDNGGKTPLWWAAARGDGEKGEIVKALVEHGGIDGAL